MMKDFVERRVSQGGYSSSSEYVRTLIRDEQKHMAETAMEVKLLEGIASGASTEMTPRDWKELRRKILTRHEHRIAQ